MSRQKDCCSLWQPQQEAAVKPTIPTKPFNSDSNHAFPKLMWQKDRAPDFNLENVSCFSGLTSGKKKLIHLSDTKLTWLFVPSQAVMAAKHG